MSEEEDNFISTLKKLASDDDNDNVVLQEEEEGVDEGLDDNLQENQLFLEEEEEDSSFNFEEEPHRELEISQEEEEEINQEINQDIHRKSNSNDDDTSSEFCGDADQIISEALHSSKENSLEEIELITPSDRETLILFAKFENMDKDIPEIVKNFDDAQIEEEETEEAKFYEEEEEEAELGNSIDNFDPTPDKDTIELLNFINQLDIERPLQVFDPAYINDLHKKEKEHQFEEKEKFVYRDIQSNIKPYKQRGNKRKPYDDLYPYDCVGLVVDPSNPEKEITQYLHENFDQTDTARIVTESTEDTPLPEHQILTPYTGEIESVILQAYLEFNGLDNSDGA
ncbi:hypothetical protein TRFO_09228 [Tritrichomonas foetus]|uniref:Uncharacterized protein n=1 Tax=Tritrichomonas foetus TaxID=1144522 RepID=A0A1J4JGL2_9EUKA|nr:hypothetical protein TRFO_09228 [Tritrichomonas foetus]|eukprot:OHS97809.1 hypothetical protein TRFO_09228 [Tritrichomonas foetus]